MKLDPRLRQLASDLVPTSDQKARVRTLMQRRIEGPAILREAKKQVATNSALPERLWQHVLQRIHAPAIATIFDRIRTLLNPAAGMQESIRSSILEHLGAPTPMPLAQRIYKWGAAFIIVVMALRASPLLFLAPQTIADSSILLRPSSNGVQLSSHGLWQPVTKETEIREAVELRTDEGEATIMLYDDGNIRLAPRTTIAIKDVSAEPEETSLEPAFTLSSGRIWMQGLLPEQVRGFDITTPAGIVNVRGGSVSVELIGNTTRIEAWDRHVTVTEGTKIVSLVSGEYVTLPSEGSLVVQNLSNTAYRQPWIAQNLERDAVHQRELAQLQQERHAADAGILPSSPLYTVKRVAESMDVLLTLDPEAKVQKRLQQATTRLNEAAAMIVQGQSGSSVPLDEYKQTLIEVASGSGDTVTQALVQQQLAENAAQLSATLPDDQLYILKQTVLQAGADLPDDIIDERDVSGTFLVDTLDVLHQAIIDGDMDQARASLELLKPYLPSLKNGSDDLRPEVRKEALALLQDVAQSLNDQDQTTSGSTLSSDISGQIAQYLPAPTEPVRPVVVELPPMTEEQLASAVQATLRRVFTIYKMPQSRVNALRVEIKKFAGKADEGRYLRRLYYELPEENTDLKQLVRQAIQLLREQQFID